MRPLPVAGCGGRAVARHRFERLCDDALRHHDRRQQADFTGSGLAQTRTGLRGDVPGTVQLDPGGGRCSDTGACDRGHQHRWRNGCPGSRMCFMRCASWTAVHFSRPTDCCFNRRSELARTTQGLASAGSIIGALANDPTLRGLTRALSFGLVAVQSGGATLNNLVRPLTLSADTLDQVLAGRPASFSWHVLLTGQQPEPKELRHFIEVRPVLNYSALEPGRTATDAIRKAAADLKLVLGLSGSRASDRPGGDGRRRVRHACGMARWSTRSPPWLSC